jgi:hypothetical protein
MNDSVIESCIRKHSRATEQQTDHPSFVYLELIAYICITRVPPITSLTPHPNTNIEPGTRRQCEYDGHYAYAMIAHSLKSLAVEYTTGVRFWTGSGISMFATTPILLPHGFGGQSAYAWSLEVYFHAFVARCLNEEATQFVHFLLHQVLPSMQV